MIVPQSLQRNPVSAADRARDIAHRCENVKAKGDGWMVSCPAHDDSNPSLSIDVDGSTVLLNCFADCAYEAILDALGLPHDYGFTEPKPSPNGHKRIVKVYPYPDAQGTLVHETVRYAPKDFRQRRPDPAHPGEYLWSLKGIVPVLYNLPAVLQALAQGETIHLAEGEDDADTLTRLGFVATTVPMGAKYWHESFTATLTHAALVIWPDNDDTGAAAVAKVQRQLKGKAKSLRTVKVPMPHKDVSDWVKAGATKADLDALVQAHTPPPPLAASLVSFTEMLALKLEPRKPYMDWLTERSLVMVYGPRGVGNTMALLGLSVSLATQTPFLKWAVSQPVGVLYVDGEMSLEELRTRAVALAGEHIPSRMAFLPSELVYARSGHDLTLTCEHRRQEVEAMLEARPDLRVLVLDNVSCLFPGISEDKKQDWEPINAWFIRLRHRGLTVLFGHHAGKGGQQRGTSGREDALDVVLALTRPPGHQAQDGCHFHLRFEKSRGVKGQTVEDLDVRLEETPEGLGWTQAPLERRRQERIRDMLDDGMPPRAIADELGISGSYVYRIKRELEGQ